MKNSFYLFYILFILLILNACNKWEQVVTLPQTGKPTSGRVVLLEDFTGASCPNCPAGADEINLLLNKYPDNLIAIAEHSNFLGSPVVKGEVKLVTKDAQDIETFLGAWAGKPELAINRQKFASQANIRIQSRNLWTSLVEEELNISPELNLEIKTTFNEVSRDLGIQLYITANKKITDVVNIHVAITESGILNTQKNTTDTIQNYINNHVLRKLITPTTGEKIADSLEQGQSISKEYHYILPTDAVLWNAAKCDVIAFASLDETKKYILQAAEAPVKN